MLPAMVWPSGFYLPVHILNDMRLHELLLPFAGTLCSTSGLQQGSLRVMHTAIAITFVCTVFRPG